MTNKLDVVILSTSMQIDPPLSVVEYEVRNRGTAPVWAVDDGWLIWSQREMKIELSFARGTMRPGAQVFGYFSPVVARVDPGGRFSKVVRLEWPLELDQLWNRDRWAAPQPGTYEVQIRVGYGQMPEPGDSRVGEGVETSVLNWQREVVSQVVKIEVPAFQHASEDS